MTDGPYVPHGSADTLLNRVLETWNLIDQQRKSLLEMADESDLLEIYALLGQLFPENPEIVAIWMLRPMPVFGGQSPLEVCLSDSGGAGRVLRRLRADVSA